MLRCFRFLGLFALLVSPSLGHAQDLGALERVVGVTGEVVALDTDPAGERWAVLFADGSVRVRNPGGSDWFLKEPRDAEDQADDAILRVENFLTDLAEADAVDGGEPVDFGEEPDEDALPDEPINDLGGDANNQLEELLQGEPTLRTNGFGLGGRGRVQWGLGDRLAITRSDGVWTSDDGGRRWRRLTDEPVRALADTGEQWVALLDDGELLQGGLRTEVYLGPLTVEVRDLAFSDGTVWAATDVGLWALRDGTWEPAGDDLSGLSQVLADPGWEGGVWAVGSDGIQRTDDGGISWEVLEGGPRRGRLRWGGPAPGGSLLVQARDVIWEHREGGWLRDGRLLDLAVGSAEGLYAVAAGEFLGPPGPDVAGKAGIPPWIPLSKLMYSALSRREFTESMGASRVVQTMMPEVIIDASMSPRDELDYLPFTTAQTSMDRRIMFRLRWTPAGRNNAGQAYEQTLEEVALRTGFDDLGIAGERGLLGAMGGQVGRRASAYRNDLSDTIRDLYAARNALYFERAALPPDTLAAEVIWELRRSEIEARLDALTDGAVSAWASNDTNPE